MINLALHKPAVQSSELASQSAHYAVNGFRRADDIGERCAITIQESDPWLRVDLGKVEMISSVMITNADGTMLGGAEIWIGNSETTNNQTDRRCGVISGIPSLQTYYFPCTAAKGRYVTVRYPGSHKILGLCEVEVYEEDKCVHPLENVALKGEATQSMALDSSAFNAIDGRRNPIFAQGSCTHSTDGDIDPWWRVDLKRTFTVINIKITNRGDCCAEKLDGAEIHIGDSLENNGNNNRRCATISHIGAGKTHTYHCDGGNLSGRYVNVILHGAEKLLILCEVEVYAAPEGTTDQL
ncbi:fucolectin-6-like [Antennarius striatus]|uniref:fucolectin-6-like n=1 Tax=Antennarius striatus TaxID=241820 RepID=UPI0035B348E6